MWTENAIKDSVTKSLPTVFLRLFEILQKINMNLLADQDDSLDKQYKNEAGEVVLPVLNSLGDVMK